MSEQLLPDKKAVYAAVQGVFVGRNATVSKPKAIRRLIDQHKDDELLAELLQKHSLEDVATVTKGLLDVNVFSPSGWLARSDLETYSRGDKETDVYRKQTAERITETLCGKCARINFGAILNEQAVPKEGVLVAHLGRNAATWDTSKCPSCRLFAWVRTPHPHDPKYRPHVDKDLGYCLYAIPALTLFEIYGIRPIKDPGFVNNTVLAVLLEKDVAEGHGVREVIRQANPDFICNVHDGSTGARVAVNGRCVDADRASPTLIAGWLQYCDANHTECGHLGGEDPMDIVKFQVIDCKERCIVPLPPGHSYVALSYVWGKQDHPVRTVDDTGCLTSGSLPTVVEDAIKVTLDAGLQYLWVDKYCIVQNDEEIRQMQLRAMDRVYKLARFTICAVAGSDAAYGLPGAGPGSRSRDQMAPRVTCKDGTTLAKASLTRAHYSRLIQRSEWTKRAWTLQEAIFSPRRVFFTDVGVYFECNTMWCSEHVDEDASIRHSRYMANPDFPHMSNDLSVDNLVQCIQQYSHRKLTYESDKLLAFLGVLEHFSKMPKPLYHLQGVPLLTSKLVSMAERSDAVTAFINGLSWELGLPSQRREGFPSWSWTGWHFTARYAATINTGTAALDQEISLTGSHQSRSNFFVWIQQHDGTVIPFPADTSQFAAFQAANTRSIPLSIHIEAWTVELRFEDSGAHWGNRPDRAAILRDNHTHEPYFVPCKGNDGYHRPGLDGDFFWTFPVDRGQPGKAYVRLDLTLDITTSGTKVTTSDDLATRLVTETWTGIVLPTMDCVRILLVDFGKSVSERIGCITMLPQAARWRPQVPEYRRQLPSALPEGAPGRGAGDGTKWAELGAQVGWFPNKEYKMKVLNEVTGMTEQERHGHGVPWSHVMETFYCEVEKSRRGIWLM